jgi:tetratricopeptide (TPR) repeat protein
VIDASVWEMEEYPVEPTYSLPMDGSAGDEAASTKRFVWRVAAAMLSVITLFAFLGMWLTPSQASARNWVSQAVNLLLIYGLFQGKSWARSWTMLRVGLAVVVIAVSYITATELGANWIDAILFLMLFVVLVGAPNRRRAIVGGVVFTVMVAVTVGVSVFSGLSGFVRQNAEVMAARQHLEQGDPQTAVQILEKVIDENPELVDAHLTLGSAYADLDRYDDALAEANFALERLPQSAIAWELRGIVLLLQERPEQALTDLDRAIEMGPQIASMHHGRAAALLALERYDEALAAANTALQLESNAPDIYITRGWVFVAKGDMSNAIADFEEAVRKLPPGAPEIAEINGIIAELSALM